MSKGEYVVHAGVLRERVKEEMPNKFNIVLKPAIILCGRFDVTAYRSEYEMNKGYNHTVFWSLNPLKDKNVLIEKDREKVIEGLKKYAQGLPLKKDGRFWM